MVSIEGENMRGVTWVVVEEVHSGDWGIGGQPLSTDAVKALAAGPPCLNAARPTAGACFHPPCAGGLRLPTDQ
jgi:hypothetical protein